MAGNPPGPALPPGYTLRRYATLDSTSSEARRLAHEGVSSGLWVVAQKQTQGRGRKGRTWTSLKGNLFASLLLYPACDLSRLPELSFVAAVAVAAALREFTGAEVTCKWPNDVMIGGEKAAGILLESESSGNPQKPWVIIGIGLNIAASPEKADYPATHLYAHTGESPDREAVFETLAQKMAEALTRWGREGFKPIRTLWLNQAEGRGQTIRVESGGAVLEGKMVGLSGTGALLLEEKQGKVIEILSGTVLRGA